MRHLVLISTDDRRNHGTGFVVRNLRDAAGAIIGAQVVTAAHVVRTVGPIEKLLAGTYRARLLVDLSREGIDLAVLEVPGLVDGVEVTLAAGAVGDVVELQGFRPPSAAAVLARPRGTLAEQTLINDRGINRPVWRIETDGRIDGGQSGGPVVAPSGAVVAVVIQGPEAGGRDAIALAIENLLAWKNGGLALAGGTPMAAVAAPTATPRESITILHLAAGAEPPADLDARPELIVITGDLSAAGLERELEATRAAVDGARGRLGLAADRVLVVPGDRDVNRKLCLAYWNECEAYETKPVPPYWPKWKPYAACFGRLYADVDRYRFTELEPWTLFELPELKLVVAGLNSTLPADHVDGHRPGAVGAEQLEWFARKLDSYAQRGWLRIGLVHHDVIGGQPALADVELLRDRLGDRLNLLVHGGAGGLGSLGALPVVGGGAQLVQLTRDRLRVRAAGESSWTEQPWRPAQLDETLPPPPVAGDAAAVPRRSEERRDPARARDDLLAEVMTWCRIHGGDRIVVERIAHAGPWGDHALVRDPDDGAWLLGAVDGAITIDVVDRWLSDVVEPFRARGRGRSDSRLIVGAAAPIDREVVRHAGARGVRVERLLDYQGVLDLDSCRAALRRRLDREPAYAQAYYLEQRIAAWTALGAAADPPEPIDSAADWIAGKLTEAGGRFVVLLGAAGVGKSFLLRALAHRLDGSATPLLLDLRQLEQARDVSALAAEQFERLGLPFHPKAFARALADGRIALLLDGFDELALRIPPAAKLEYFERIRKLAGDGARIVITSRTEQFLSRPVAAEPGTPGEITALGATLGQVARRTVAEVLPFRSDDVRHYLERRLGVEPGAAWYRLLAQGTDLIALASTPRLLAFLIDIPRERLIEALDRGAPITTATIYELAIDRSWLADERARLADGGRPELTLEALVDAATQLALRLWRESQVAVRATDLGAVAGPIVSAMCEGDRDPIGPMPAARSLLTRTGDGRVRFIHQTVLEWLATRAVARELRDRGASDHLAVGRLNRFMIELLRDLVGKDALAGWSRAILASGTDGIAAENARDVNERLGLEDQRRADLRNQDLRGQDLRGQDLRGARLDGANLAGVRLVGRDLTGASLRGANLADADLTDADLTGADLTGADLSFARLHRANLERAIVAQARLFAASVLGVRNSPFAVDGAGPAIVVARPHWPARAFAWSSAAGGARVIASAHDDGTVRVWDVARGLLVRVLTGPRGGVVRVGWDPDGESIAALATSGSLRQWQLAGAGSEPIAADSGRARPVTLAAADPTGLAADGSTIAFFVEGHLMISDRQGDSRRHLAGEGMQPEALAWSRGGRLFLGGDALHAWQPDVTAPAKSVAIAGEAVTAIAVSPDDRTVAFAAGEIRLWRPGGAGEPQELSAIAGSPRRTRCLAWSPDGQTLAGGAEDGDVWTQAIGAASDPVRIGVHNDGTWAVAWHPEGKLLASGGGDGLVVLSDPTRWTPVNAPSPGGVVWSLSWRRATAGGLVLLAAGASSGEITLWHDDGTPYHAFRGHDDWVLDLGWSPDGATLASVSADRTVRLWSWNGGDLVRELRGHGGSVLALAWSPDGRHLATTAADQTMRLWRVADGACVAIVHATASGWVAFLDDGRYQVHGDVGDSFWHVIGLHRYEVGELDELLPGLRIAADRPLLTLGDV